MYRPINLFKSHFETIRLSLEAQTLGSEALFLVQEPRSIDFLLLATNGVHLLNLDCEWKTQQ